jgi:hypothetical protein
MSVFAGPNIVEDGLVVCLDAANPKSYPGSGTTWTDLSGKGLTGTLTGGPTYSSSNGGSIAFDGTVGKYVALTYNSSNFRNTDFTWIAWVLGRGSPTVNMPQIGYGSGGWPRLGFFENNGTWNFLQYNGSGPPTISQLNCGSSSTTVWKQICCVGNFSGSQLLGYNNGAYVAAASYVDSNGNDSAFGIGRSGSTNVPWGEAFLGNVAQVSLYNRILSPSEISQNFNAMRGRFGI